MHKISIDLKVDQLRQLGYSITSDQLAVLIEWVITLALHGHFDLVECDNVTVTPLTTELIECIEGPLVI
jgi:hypothetical protein